MEQQKHTKFEKVMIWLGDTILRAIAVVIIYLSIEGLVRFARG